MERILHDWTMDGSSVLDPMCGSGATCIAAHRLGRRWMGIDRSERYCQVASRRLQWYVEHNALPDTNDPGWRLPRQAVAAARLEYGIRVSDDILVKAVNDILGAAGLCLLDRGADLEIREAAGRVRVPGKEGACVP
jgi:hypothetical protein